MSEFSFRCLLFLTSVQKRRHQPGAHSARSPERKNHALPVRHHQHTHARTRKYTPSLYLVYTTLTLSDGLSNGHGATMQSFKEITGKLFRPSATLTTSPTGGTAHLIIIVITFSSVFIRVKHGGITPSVQNK